MSAPTGTNRELGKNRSAPVQRKTRERQMTNTRYRKSFQIHPRGDGEPLGLTYVVEITSWLHGYSARVEELVSDGQPVPVMIATATGPREEVSLATFHRMRRHHRGALVGAVLAALRRGDVERIDEQRHVPTVAAFDCYIRVNRLELESGRLPVAEPLPVVISEDDMRDWDEALEVFPE